MLKRDSDERQRAKKGKGKDKRKRSIHTYIYKIDRRTDGRTGRQKDRQTSCLGRPTDSDIERWGNIETGAVRIER
jgi:hypothetical protein